MARVWGLLMAKLLDNKGYTLLETVAVLIIYITFVNVTFYLIKPSNYESESLILYSQIDSMTKMQRHHVNPSLWFNHRGHPNLSQKIEIGNKICLIYLGYGRYRCE